MSNAVSALGGVSHAGSVRVEEIGPQGMITLRGDLASTAVKNAATGVTGLDMPGVREATCVGEKAICWMSPDELLMLVPYGEVGEALAKIDKTLKGKHYLAENVSDARGVFQLHGPKGREVLAKLCPVDLSPGAFEPGMFRRTRLAQVAAAFWMRDAETFEIVCFRSVAQYVFDVLKTAADPEADVGYF